MCAVPGTRLSQNPNKAGALSNSCAEPEKEGHRIFDESVWREIKSAGNLFDEKYPSDGIEEVLHQFFDPARLKDALTEVLITSYEIERRIPWFFRSSRAKTRPDYDFEMWQVARSTSAAPTYFEPEKIPFGNGTDFWALIDGGVFANNPAMCAFAEVRSRSKDGDILLASLGTGELSVLHPIHFDQAKNWGLIGWAKPILDVVFDGVSKTIDYQLRQLLPLVNNAARYYRFQPRLDIGSGELDNTNPENLRDLRLLAERLIASRTKEIDDLCAQLTQP